MKVISVNVGLPREVEWKGQKITTSIFKEPVCGKTIVRLLNLDGDGQADLNAHGGEHRAVFVYQKESYAYWGDYLKRGDLKYGQFGENLTVEGLPDADVCIGDQYQIGTATFEVTQPRVTCYKIAISIGVPEMPALLVAHKRPGFYFRVLQEGEICAGDTINKLKSGPENMTVEEIDQLLYSSQHPQQSLEKALKIPALSEGWQWSFNGLLEAAIHGVKAGNAGLNQTAPIAWTGFKPFTVKRIHDECIGIRSFDLTSKENLTIPDYLPGQHIALRLNINGENTPTIRMYSLCGPSHTDFYRIAVKIEPGGLGSSYLHQQIKTGDIIEISAPRGEFILANGDNPVALLSAGVGITPVIAMLYALSAIRSTRKIFWLHSAQNGAHQSFPGVAHQLGEGLSDFNCVQIFSRPDEKEKVGVDYDLSGHLNLDMLKSLNIPLDTECYLCGPAAYLNETTEALKSLGIPDNHIKYEAFGNERSPKNKKAIAPHLPIDNSGEGPLITFTKSNISFKWNVKWNSLLEAAEAAEIPVQWSCRVGVCHRCESSCLDGKVNYDPAPFDNPAEGNVLLCCAKPLTDILLDL
ncbi:MOSC domain-containing protein [Mucilaginibacter sp. E4BP6]|uniref:MOSC and FAD-binding oxidoreductase domain-containing protein n=1 Tax=Mucilaginibacter sp. E4BP6 TaxID=2723089 RepID=UPI0015CA1344|nr:MOSC and FAD-binding oxidoreductase domain-containing protein [Mucilaginibacter sp. E4BP6]NYE67023.1 ferredoxin-NADP reductase/MOSC domain-containing protein YiiM [Mucilaginibacter sp. E4BP6]